MSDDDHDDDEKRELRVSLFDLSLRQRQTIGVALTLIAALVIGWILVKVLLGAMAFISTFANVFLPLAAAFILALVLKPYYEWLHTRWDWMSENLAIAAIFVTFLAPVGLIVFVFGKALVAETSDLAARVPRMSEQVQTYAKGKLEDWDHAGLRRNLEELERGLQRSGQSNEAASVHSMVAQLRADTVTVAVVSNVKMEVSALLGALRDRGLEREHSRLGHTFDLLDARLEDESLWQKYGLTQKVQELLSKKGGDLAGIATTMLGNVFEVGRGAIGRLTGLLGWFVVPVYLAFFLRMRPIPKNQRKEWFSFLKKETKDDVVYLIDQFVEIMVSFFRGQMLIAFIQAVLLAIGFKLLGLKFGFMIGFSLGMLNIIPYLGSMIGLGVALPVALFQGPTWHGLEGGWVLVIGVLAIFAVVQAIEAYILTPRIMGDRTGLHPMAIIVAIFFWGTAFEGIMGMLLAIPLTAFLVVFWRLFKRKELLTEWF